MNILTKDNMWKEMNFSLWVIANQEEKGIKEEPGGRNWSRLHGAKLFIDLLSMAFLYNPEPCFQEYALLHQSWVKKMPIANLMNAISQLMELSSLL